MNGAFTKSNLPVPVSPAAEERPGRSGMARQEAPRAAAAERSVFDAQVLGQTGQKRGLKGGQPVLEAARTAYLDAEWRGADDRRLPPGALRRVTL